MSATFGVIVIFPVYGQFMDSGRIICKTYILNNSNAVSYKKGKQN